MIIILRGRGCNSKNETLRGGAGTMMDDGGAQADLGVPPDDVLPSGRIFRRCQAHIILLVLICFLIYYSLPQLESISLVPVSLPVPNRIWLSRA